jgi:TonB family protein
MPPGRRRFISIMRSKSFSLAALAVSAAGHLLLLGSVLLVAHWAGLDQQKVYVVNLVSGIPSLGRPGPSAAPEAPSLPVRQPVAPQAVREAARDGRDRQESAKQAEPSMPPARKSTEPSLPRPGEKELPSLSHSPIERRTVASPPLGRPGGSPTAAPNSSVSLDAGNFPFAWYIRQMQQKIEEQWSNRPPLTRPDQPPVVRVEILRNGSIKPPTIEKSSGNSTYDRAALRAVMEASPFPPLPQEWPKSSLKVELGFIPSERG